MILSMPNRGSRPARGWAYHARPGGQPSRASLMRCQVLVGRDLVRCAARASALFAIPLIAACTPSTTVQGPSGMALLEVRRGTCFVGCNVRAQLPDGTKCGGYAIAMEYGRSLSADIYCPGKPTATLLVEDVKRDGVSVGTLTPDTSLFASEPVDTDAIIAKHVPSSET